MQQKVLYITYDGLNDPLGQSQILPYLCGLSGKDYLITILSCEKKEKLLPEKEKITQLLNKHNINWEFIFYSKYPPYFSYLVNYLSFKKKAVALYKKNKFNIIHCRSYISSLIGLSFKKKYGVKFIFDMRGFWADERMEGKIWKNNFIYKQAYSFFKNKEFEFLQNADYTVSLTENAKKEIYSWKTFSEKKPSIKVIPCCADLNLFSENNTSLAYTAQLKRELNILDSHFILSYIGSVGTWYLLEEMFLFFKLLKSKKSNSLFLIITPDDKTYIQQKAKQVGIDTADLRITHSKRKDMPSLIGISNLAVFFIKPSYSKKASSPTKMAELMAMEIPFITNSGIGDNDQIIKDSGAGIVMPALNEKEYLSAIAQIDNFMATYKKSNVRKMAEPFFSLESGVNKYAEIYQAITQP